MSDIKLFRIGTGGASEVTGATMVVERRLQNLFEQNLEALLGVRFLASEFSTGPVHSGRIDTLGIDEDGSPVIIEYKRMTNENVMNQGLYYLDWLLDHRGDFSMLVQQTFGAEEVGRIDWSGPRLLCIAGDFTRYDQHAVKQMPRNIELIRYRSFGDDLLMVELVHNQKTVRAGRTTVTRVEPALDTAIVVSTSADGQPTKTDSPDSNQSQRMDYRVSQTKGELREVYDATFEFLENLGDDVQVKEQKYYVAFKRIKNFACLEVYPKAKVVFVHLKLDPASVSLEEGFTRDMTNTGHFGTGNLQVAIRTMDDFRKAQPLLQSSYDLS
jgi:predicted transport protein